MIKLANAGTPNTPVAQMKHAKKIAFFVKMKHSKYTSAVTADTVIHTNIINAKRIVIQSSISFREIEEMGLFVYQASRALYADFFKFSSPNIL